MNEIIQSFGLDWKIFTAEIVNFIIVLFVLYYFLFRKVFSNLENRQKIIKEGIKKGEQASFLIEDAEKKAGEILAESRLDANDRIKDALEKVSEKEKDILENAEKEKNNILEKAEKKSKEIRDNALDDLDKDIAKLAILSAEKVLSKK